MWLCGSEFPALAPQTNGLKTTPSSNVASANPKRIVASAGSYGGRSRADELIKYSFPCCTHVSGSGPSRHFADAQ
jgi:hypothetical protein